MKCLKNALLIFIVLNFISCQRLIYYKVTNEAFHPSNSRDYTYTKTADGLSVAVKAYTELPIGMKMELFIKNENYDSVSYQVNQIRFINQKLHQEEIRIDVDGKKVGLDFECFLKRNEHVYIYYITSGNNKEYLNEFELELGEVIILNDSMKIEFDTVKLVQVI